jgi:hypothetical protein
MYCPETIRKINSESVSFWENHDKTLEANLLRLKQALATAEELNKEIDEV